MEELANGWSMDPKDKVDGEAYLVLAIVAGSKGTLSERLVMAAWSATKSAWQFEGDEEEPAMPPGPKLDGKVIHVLCWHHIGHIPPRAWVKAEAIVKLLSRHQPANGIDHSPEDINNGEEFEFDFPDWGDD